ncbi:MAG: polysulfide reductase NrfD [Proteobacteria bacterium]|nr:polysulfide reductase NrfD [Pseudomonadota bacterium]
MGIVRSRIERQVQGEWRGMVAIYLFLGGVGAGAYVVAATGSILGSAWANVTNAGLYLSFPVVIIGTLFLLAHLGAPMRAPLAMAKIGSSWISRGVWILSIFILLSIIHFGLLYTGGEEAVVPVAVPLLGMLFAVFTMLYTGALISGAKGYPFWHTSILPILFLVSGLLTGMFAVVLGMVAIDSTVILADQMKKMAAIGGALIVVELLIIFFFLHSAYKTPDSRESAQRMMGKSSFIFGDLILGLFVPLIICLAVYFGMDDVGGMTTAMTIAAILGLIGGFLLRNAILAAGMQTSLTVSGFHFRPIAKLDFVHSPIGKLPPQ